MVSWFIHSIPRHGGGDEIPNCAIVPARCWLCIPTRPVGDRRLCLVPTGLPLVAWLASLGAPMRGRPPSNRPVNAFAALPNVPSVGKAPGNAASGLLHRVPFGPPLGSAMFIKRRGSPGNLKPRQGAGDPRWGEGDGDDTRCSPSTFATPSTTLRHHFAIYLAV